MSAATSDNATKLQAFVDARLAAAREMPPVEAVWFLRRWAKHVAVQQEELARYALGSHALPEHLVGLQVSHLIAAEGQLSSAANRYEDAVKALVAA